ncbi:hypothetical protein B0O80DRAFT_443906 [Mortierella sp. GBAus27b]|nr:hypothetical protein B0O80DRAFT_443906 [Mortierella sp. GBAus27b]
MYPRSTDPFSLFDQEIAAISNELKSIHTMTDEEFHWYFPHTSTPMAYRTMESSADQYKIALARHLMGLVQERLQFSQMLEQERRQLAQKFEQEKLQLKLRLNLENDQRPESVRAQVATPTSDYPHHCCA